jgi:hypothetical protein
MRTAKELTILASSRIGYRKKLVKAFLSEKPGKGRGDLCSQYIYYVDKVLNGNRVFLKRPAVLNKGFDFEVHVENYNFGTKRHTSMPSHKVILTDLIKKRNENPAMYEKVETLISQAFRCQQIEDEALKQISFDSGFPFDVILKTIKWLFIEQDVTYWNWSGRNMLYSAIMDLT